ncbi:MAG TPA: hypothetical protein VN363_05035 [Anaerolineales bacterium]|nr:hypothetical protein [Anaerolineales bacterium]
MKKPSLLRPYLLRLGVILIVSIVFVLIFNEAVFLLQKEDHDRAPRTIELVIPAGTAGRVAAGEDDPAIPAEMVFVMGDTLLVRNEDSASHQLGPVWVPAGATASLAMGEPAKLAYACSFSTTRYLNLDVRQPTTFGTRLTALILAAPTLAALLYIYSLLVFPVGGKPSGKTAEATSINEGDA